ncbi:MAG: polysaccharide biosynthesis protein [Ruminococcaceae bacterium]|nr:polysaccharide biosynthesis protein [Oscillospiraceae bacterium]
MKKRLFIKNAAILTFTGIILRVIGIFFRIYISKTIGAEGMGLHQLIFSIYTFASAVASSGVSVAVTRLVSEKNASKNAADKILSRALFISMFLGLLSFTLMFFGADFIAEKWLCDMRAARSLKILSTGLPFMALCSCFKGYFTARRKMSTPSNSQLFEQLVRIFVVVILLGHISTDDLDAACSAVVCGNALSEVAAFIYIYIGYVRDKKLLCEGKEAPAHVMRSLVYIFIPIALSTYLNTALHTIENVMVPDALTRYTQIRELSLSQFGTLKGMALPLLFFPASFIGTLSTLLMPEISAYSANKQYSALKSTINYTLLITLLTSIPISAIFCLYANEIALLVYKNAEVGIYIKTLAPILPFMYTEGIIAGILNALNKQAASLRYNLYNSAVRITLITIFVPGFGMRAFVLIMIVSNIMTSSLNMRQLILATNMSFDIKKLIIKPILAVLPALLCAYLLKAPFEKIFINNLVSLILGIFILCAVYICFILLFKCITKNDMRPILHKNRR